MSNVFKRLMKCPENGREMNMDVGETQGMIERVLKRYSGMSQEDKEDLRQEAFLRVLQKKMVIEVACKGRSEDDRLGYIFRVVQSAVRSAIRTSVRWAAIHVNSIDFHQNLRMSISRNYPDAALYNDELPMDSTPGMEERENHYNSSELKRLSVYGISNQDLAVAREALPPEQKHIVTERFENGESIRSICRSIGRPHGEKYVNNRSKKGLKTMRITLGVPAWL